MWWVSADDHGRLTSVQRLATFPSVAREAVLIVLDDDARRRMA